MTIRAALPFRHPMRLAAVLSLCALAACGQGGIPPSQHEAREAAQPRQSTIWDLFSNSGDPQRMVAVNRYLWNASLEVLDLSLIHI